MEKVKSAYEGIMEETSKPMLERGRTIKGRKGKMRVPRRYHLLPGKLKAHKEIYEATGILPNPYRKGGVYHGFIQALITLGSGKVHSFADVKAKMRQILSGLPHAERENSWEAFANRVPSGSAHSRDINGRILQNARLLQRIDGFHPYGYKLKQLGACLDILKDENGLPQFRLTISSPDAVCPVNTYQKHRKKRRTPPTAT